MLPYARYCDDCRVPSFEAKKTAEQKNRCQKNGAIRKDAECYANTLILAEALVRDCVTFAVAQKQ
jgi:hypothetical protein